MNLRSLEKVNLSTASIRSNGSSESLMLDFDHTSEEAGYEDTVFHSRSKEIRAV